MADYLLEARNQMVDRQLAARGIQDRRLLDAMRKVPRHLFCDPPNHPEAYEDYPLPIGFGQTISQPYMVAAMTERLLLTGAERVLEIGTGSGYQTAVLAELAAEVYSIERVPALADRARETLDGQGCANVHIRVGDGTLGWPGQSPFDRIIVTAGAPRVPPPLTQQLADGGILVIPVGDRFMQALTVVTRRGDKLDEDTGMGCTFVKLIGKEGWDEV